MSPVTTHFPSLSKTFFLLLWNEKEKLYDFITFSKKREILKRTVFVFVGMFIGNNQINTLFLIVSHLCSFWPPEYGAVYILQQPTANNNKNTAANR